MTDATAPPKRTWTDAVTAYGDRRVLAMLFLGFSAGLPILLVFGTLSMWLREANVSRTTIGFFVLTTFAYSLKFAWAPVVDRLALPYLTRRLGRRRSWMLVAQVVIAAGLVGMALTDPRGNLALLAGFAIAVALGSATQDIAIDAFRIEISNEDLQGSTAGAYQLGYRLAMLLAGAGAIYIAQYLTWNVAYFMMAAFVGVGIVTVLIIAEPAPRIDPAAARIEAALTGALVNKGPLGRLGAWFTSAVVGPFADFFARHGWMALVILLFIGSFRLTDIAMGVMANPFYIDVGFSKTDIADVTKIYGIWIGIAGALLGGVIVLRYGIKWPLLVCAIVTAATNMLFYLVAVDGREMLDLGACQDAMCLPDFTAPIRGGNYWLLMLTISAENVVGGAAGTVLIAYLSSLTNAAYTATQYALFSSFMSLVGKIVGSTSGLIVDAEGYPFFFVYTTLLGLPAVLLVLVLFRRPETAPMPQPAAKTPAPAAAAKAPAE